MADPVTAGGIFGGLSGGTGFGAVTGTLIRTVGWLMGAFIFLGLVIFLVKWKKTKKSYNIPVTIWIPRSDGKIMDEFPAIGGYFKSASVGGITSFRLKRKGVSTLDIPPPSSRFLVGLNRKLYLVQKGMDDFEPVLPESFKTVETEALVEGGKPVRKAVINLKCTNQDSTAWRFDNEQNARKRFTLWGLWDKYKDIIQMSIFIFIVVIACYIMWSGLKDFVVELARLVDILAKWNNSCGGISMS